MELDTAAKVSVGERSVEEEIQDLEQPWNLAGIESRIQEYTTISEAINKQLSARVMANYNAFVQGMQQVQAVETELTLIGVLVKNGRRKLQERDQGLVRGSMQITWLQRKSDRLRQVLSTLAEFQGVVEIDTRLRECLMEENYCEAIAKHFALRQTLSEERVRNFPGLQKLREGLHNHRAVIQQKLSDGLRVAAVSAEFDADRYEAILKAYSMMAPDQEGHRQALSVGKELLRHVSECIVAVSKQCMHAFSPAPSHESPSDWHRKAQIKDLARSMDPTHFVACTAQLYELLCDFLYRHKYLCSWHVARAQAPEVEGKAEDADFQEMLRDVHTELSASKRNVWDRIQQQVSLVLMTLDFQYPALSEDNFLHILHLTQLLIEEGDAFMADFQQPRNPGQNLEGRRQFSAPIRNTLKSKTHDYFESLHFNAWACFKVAYIEQDTWQRLPVARSYSLIRQQRLKPLLPRQVADGDRRTVGNAELQKLCAPETNPFRNYKAEPLVGIGDDDVLPSVQIDGSQGTGIKEGADELDEHALLQHWIDENEGLPNEHIGSSMLSNSNRSPVVSKSTEELAKLLERYFRMMSAMPQLALDIFQAATQLIEFYVHCILCLFVQDRHLRILLEDIDPQLQPTDPKLAARHETFIWQRYCPELRRAAMRTREFLSSLPLPDSVAASLNLQPGLSGAVFLQVMPFPKLTSPSSLCGLSERCVGVESVAALLADLKDLQERITGLLPRGAAGETIDRFFSEKQAVASQLRTFVLMCAARDILEVPDLGRVSLDHLSNTVQALKWEGKDFSQGSPMAPYLEQLRGQIEELARRIPCAGGGSIPHLTQRTVWGWMEVRIIHECVEVIAKCGKKKSQEAIFCMAEDFKAIRDTVQQFFKPAEGTDERLVLLLAEHPLANTVCWAYLEAYLEAHNGGVTNDVVSWCKRHSEYPLRLHKALIEYLHSNPKMQKHHLTELEVHFAALIVEENAGAGSQRGL